MPLRLPLLLSVMVVALPVLAAPVPLGEALRSHGYRAVTRRHGVVAYRRTGSDVIRMAAEGMFQAPPAVVQRALLSYPRHPGVLERLAESRILRRGDGWLLVYQRLDLPLISDRDFTLRVSWWRKGGSRWISFRVARGDGPPRRKGVVRMSLHQGSWQLSPECNGRCTRARFMVSSDLAGWLPRWLTRSRASDDLPNLFQGIRKLLKGG
jgi:hypothetical protein